MIRRLLRWSLAKAGHPRAPAWLTGVAFAEATFFPVPPDVLLAPMALQRPDRAWRFAALATLGSVAGGMVGYALGFGLYEAVAEPLITTYGAAAEYERAAAWFAAYGAWAIFLAGFTPIPYKVFTIAAGSLAMPVLPFALASVAGRGLRFFALAGVLRWGGSTLYERLERWSPALFWGGLALLIALVLHGWLGGG
jgi:membrane protein YqaA with SNARE-associated domain